MSIHQSDNSGMLNISLVGQNVKIRKRRTCPLKEISEEEINYKNLTLLKSFLSSNGKIIGRNISGVSRKKQSLLANSIKIARRLGLLSFVSVQTD